MWKVRDMNVEKERRDKKNRQIDLHCFDHLINRFTAILPYYTVAIHGMDMKGCI